MRTRHVSLAALITAAAFAANLTPGLADDPKPSAGAPGVATTPTPETQASPTATVAEPKPEPVIALPAIAPPAAVEVPAALLALPSTAPNIELAPPMPAFNLAAELATRIKAERASDTAREDRDAAAKIYELRQGVPIWVTETGYAPKALALMTEIRNADGYALQASAFRLPEQKFGSGAPSAAELADAEATLSLAALKYARHARGGRTDPQALSKMFDRKPQIYQPTSVLSELAAAGKPDAYLRSLHPSHPQFEKLRLKYLAAKSGQSLGLTAVPEPQPAPEAKGKTAVKSPPAALSNSALEKKLLANLEMWRWMPDVGETYIQNNIPEFTTRVVRGGKVVHLERIVTGKSDTPTPIFSNEMAVVVFKPFWNVPESIKWKELQPQLQRNSGALAKVGLKASFNGREVDPSSVDWNATDLRQFHVFQPPGAANALGQVKFLFPNKHDVYMHDTPSKSLFNQNARAFSHGCMRVRDPLRLAEVLLAHDKGMTRADIQNLADRGPENNEIRLSKKVPIHVTYFTAWVDDEGSLKTFNDLYAHEGKVLLGIDGKAHLIAQARPDSERPPLRPRDAPVFRQAATQKSSGNPFETWAKSVFNF